MPVRVAVDTNVLLSGLIWPRWQYEMLQHALRGDVQLVLPEIVILEARRQIQRNFPESQEDFERFLALVDYELAPLPMPRRCRAAGWCVRLEDIPVALSVIAGDVNYFVTYDRDFTDEHASTLRVRIAIPGYACRRYFCAMSWAGRARNSRLSGIVAGPR